MKKLFEVLVWGITLLWLILSYVWGIEAFMEAWDDYMPKIKGWFRKVFHKEKPEYVSDINE